MHTNRRINRKRLSWTSVSIAIMSSILLFHSVPANASESASPSNKKTEAMRTQDAKKSAQIKKPIAVPWGEVAAKKDEQGTKGKFKNSRTYNIFKYKVAKGADPSKPDNWRTFDPYMFPNKKQLVPSPSSLTGLVPEKYAATDMALPQDPTKTGIQTTPTGLAIVFAHQGTPMANGWIAPQAGYAYEFDGRLVFGTTNYTPINYNGEMSKHLGLDKIPVDIISPSGAKEKLDLSRLVFAVNDELMARPHSKIYPSVIYLTPGESAAIQGYGTVQCPPHDQHQDITMQTPVGEQTIKIYCSPDKPVIPGKVTP